MTRILCIVFAGVLLFGRAASAHRIDEYLQATLVSIEPDRARMLMRLVPGTLVATEVIAAIDLDRDGAFSEAERRAYAERVVRELTLSVDQAETHARVDAWRFPSPDQMREGLGEISVEYTVPLPRGSSRGSIGVENHHWREPSVYLMNTLVPRDTSVRIVAQRRNAQQSRYEVDYERTPIAATVSAARTPPRLDAGQFASLFHLGMRHIAEGTDHLLFLLVLLLPAPLRAACARWRGAAGVRQALAGILRIVTAFTVGHSLTLALGALGALGLNVLPGRPVEALVALSIMVSAVHAIRPIFPGREARVAACFGLVHGLAFAATLDRLGLDAWTRSAGVLAFNLGIETMQMLVVAAVLPSLLLLAATRAYALLRIGGAAFAGVASAFWLLERTLGLDLPVDEVVDAIARHAGLLALGLFLVSLGCRLFARLRGQAAPSDRARPAAV